MIVEDIQLTKKLDNSSGDKHHVESDFLTADDKRERCDSRPGFKVVSISCQSRDVLLKFQVDNPLCRLLSYGSGNQESVLVAID